MRPSLEADETGEADFGSQPFRHRGDAGGGLCALRSHSDAMGGEERPYRNDWTRGWEGCRLWL